MAVAKVSILIARKHWKLIKKILISEQQSTRRLYANPLVILTWELSKLLMLKIEENLKYDSEKDHRVYSEQTKGKLGYTFLQNHFFPSHQHTRRVTRKFSSHVNLFGIFQIR